MTRDLPLLRRSHALGVLLAAALLLALQLLPGAPDLLRFSRSGFDAGQWWQLLSSQAVHLSLPHAAFNAIALAVSLLAWRVWVVLPAQGIALLGGALGVALVLTLDRDCTFYAGLSGALHGLWAGNAVFLMRACPKDSPGKRSEVGPLTGLRVRAVVVLLALIGKMLLQAGNAAGAFDAWLEMSVYRPAHWAGLGGGLVAAGLALWFRGLPATAAEQRHARQTQQTEPVPPADRTTTACRRWAHRD